MKTTRPRKGTYLGIVAVVLMLLVLGLQYLGTFYAVQLTLLSKENELKHHLEDLGRVAGIHLAASARALDELAIDSAWEARARTEAGQLSPPADRIFAASLTDDLTAPIAEFAAGSRLNRVVVLDADGRVLYDAARTTETARTLLRPFDFWEIDRPQVEAALRGKIASTPAYSTTDAEYQRTYVPIAANDAASSTPPAARAAAVVCLVAGRDYLAEIDQLRRVLRRANGRLTILMALIGLLIWRLTQRQRRSERLAAENDRLAALGRLAAGFAHELRNPLGIIRAFTEDLQHTLRQGGNDPAALEACDEIIEEVDRMNRLVGQFLGYSRGRATDPATGRTPLVEAVESVLGILRPSADKQGVTLRIEHAPAVRADASRWRAGIDTGALRQILVNLLLNAIEVSPRGGLVRIGLSVQPRRVRVTVADQGPGIPKSDRARIFEPFYTTREGGSGLGLMISRQIAEAAAGTLDLAANPPGGGACLELTLPRAADTPAAGESAPPEESQPKPPIREARPVTEP
jgi:signal transduction histidine kinase